MATKKKIDSNKKKYLKIIKKIENLREKNNKHWMNLYRLAFINNPKKASKIVNEILKKDNEISKNAKILSKIHD